MTRSRRTCLVAVLTTAVIPGTLLAARSPDRNGIGQYAAGAAPDSVFLRADIAKAKTPKACKVAIDSAAAAAYKRLAASVKQLPREAREDARDRGYAGILASKKVASATCARRFKLAMADSSDLRVLIDLYTAADMEEPLHAALDRRIAMAATIEARVLALLDVVSRYADNDTTPERTALAEPYMAHLDALGDSARGARVLAHALVSGSRNWYHVTDPLARSHAAQALALARALPPEERTKTYVQGQGGVYAVGMLAAADEDAATGDYKTAVAILNEGIATLGDTSKSSDVQEMLSAFRRYALVGTRAPAVTAEHWLNAPAATTALPYSGRVTLMEFTTTWCGWCKKGYPAMRRLATKYRDRGFQAMFVSLIEGAGMSKPDTVEAELAYDREHWVTHDSITFPIAIYDTKIVVDSPKIDSSPPPKASNDSSAKAVKDSTADSTEKAQPPSRETPTLFRQYVVDGYPAYYFVDKKGIIRGVQLGHRADIERRFMTIIEGLLAEPAASAAAPAR